MVVVQLQAHSVHAMSTLLSGHEIPVVFAVVLINLQQVLCA